MIGRDTTTGMKYTIVDSWRTKTKRALLSYPHRTCKMWNHLKLYKKRANKARNGCQRIRNSFDVADVHGWATMTTSHQVAHVQVCFLFYIKKRYTCTSVSRKFQFRAIQSSME